MINTFLCSLFSSFFLSISFSFSSSSALSFSSSVVFIWAYRTKKLSFVSSHSHISMLEEWHVLPVSPPASVSCALLSLSCSRHAAVLVPPWLNETSKGKWQTELVGGTETSVKGQIKGSLWSSAAFSSDLMVLWYKFVYVACICIQGGAPYHTVWFFWKSHCRL